MALVSIFFGAAFTLASCYALGALLLRRVPAPPEIVLGLGAVAQSLLIFILLLLGLGDWRAFLAIGAVPLVMLVKTLRRPAKAKLVSDMNFGAVCRNSLSDTGLPHGMLRIFPPPLPPIDRHTESPAVCVCESAPSH